MDAYIDTGATAAVGAGDEADAVRCATASEHPTTGMVDIAEDAGVDLTLELD